MTRRSIHLFGVVAWLVGTRHGCWAFSIVLPEPMARPSLGLLYSKNDDGHIEVASTVELPFSADVAFVAFSDLTRQPSFSPWLKSVEYTDGITENGVGATSLWKVRFLGLGFSWKSVSTCHDREKGVLEWESLTGLKNNGRCEFVSLAHDKSTMHLTMSFQFGRTVRLLLGKNGNKIKELIENRMLSKTTQNFSQMVLLEGKQHNSYETPSSQREP